MSALPRGQTPRPYVIPDPYPQQQQMQQQRQTPRPIHGDYGAYGPNAYGSRARPTVPAPYHPALDGDIEVQIRGRCRNCRGSGVVSGREWRCTVCRRRYSDQTIEQCPHYGFRDRRIMLPCHHEALKRDIVYARPACIYCEGDGYLYRYVRWDDFMQEMYPDEAGELDEQTTSALRALRRAQSAREPVDPFTRSGEPTAPAPHLTTTTYGAGTGGPNQERMTPHVGPHLPPLAPERESGEGF